MFHVKRLATSIQKQSLWFNISTTGDKEHSNEKMDPISKRIITLLQ